MNLYYSRIYILNNRLGQCNCRNNTDSRRCDKCKAGYFDYPRCYECDCHVEGTLTQICDPVTAQCLCKENTMGDRCEYCKPGTFNIEERNPKGCTQCFCFGQTTQCIMSDLYISPVNDIAGDWKLAHAKTNANQSNVQLGFERNDEEGLSLGITGSDDLISPATLTETLYWSAPSSYTGACFFFVVVKL